MKSRAQAKKRGLSRYWMMSLQNKYTFLRWWGVFCWQGPFNGCQYHNLLKILYIKRISHCFRYCQRLRYIAGKLGTREKMNNVFFLGLHSLFLSLKQRHQIIFNYSGMFVFSTFDYRFAYGGMGKAQRPGNFSTWISKQVNCQNAENRPSSWNFSPPTWQSQYVGIQIKISRPDL